MACQFDQHIAGLDQAAFLEANGGDDLGDLGGYLDGFVCPGSAECVDFIREILRGDLRRNHADGALLCLGSGICQQQG